MTDNAGRWRGVLPWALIGALFQLAIFQIPDAAAGKPWEILSIAAVVSCIGALLGTVAALLFGFMRQRPTRSALPFRDMTGPVSMVVTALIAASVLTKVFIPPSILPLLLAGYPIIKISRGRPKPDVTVFE